MNVNKMWGSRPVFILCGKGLKNNTYQHLNIKE